MDQWKSRILVQYAFFDNLIHNFTNKVVLRELKA